MAEDHGPEEYEPLDRDRDVRDSRSRGGRGDDRDRGRYASSFLANSCFILYFILSPPLSFNINSL